MKTYGIVLGSSHARISYALPGGNVGSISTTDGSNSLESVLFIGKNECIVGATAWESAGESPERFFRDILQKLGTSWQKNINSKVYTPESMASIIISRLIKDAEIYGYEVKDAVITCPACFDERAQQALKGAGIQAGLNEVQILAAPIAIAVANGYAISKKPKTLLVYNLGASLFEASVLKVDAEGIHIISTATEQLGGQNWSAALQKLVLTKLKAEFPEAGNPLSTPETANKLYHNIEKLKHMLSIKEEATARVFCPDDTIRKINIRREEFESATRNLLERTHLITNEVLKVAAQEHHLPIIDHILLAGGACRMPQVTQSLCKECRLSREALAFSEETTNIQEAHGAAVYANIMRQLQQGYTEPEALSLPKPRVISGTSTLFRPSGATAPVSLGIMVSLAGGEEYCYNLIRKGAPLPASNSITIGPVPGTGTSIVIYANNDPGIMVPGTMCVYAAHLVCPYENFLSPDVVHYTGLKSCLYLEMQACGVLEIHFGATVCRLKPTSYQSLLQSDIDKHIILD